MMKQRTLSAWILRLIAIMLLFSIGSSDDTKNWNNQFMELKAMITVLDSKITSMDSRLNSLNVLEYAFKMNTIDNSMTMLNTRIDHMAAQVDSIKESVRNLPTSPCTGVAPTQSPQHPRSSPPSEDNLSRKLDDYGKKLMQSQQHIKSSSEDHHRYLTDFVEVVRSGFTKVVTKIDSFLALEGQMSAIIPLIRQMSATTDFISEEVSNIATSIRETKASCTSFANPINALETQISTISPLVRQLSDTTARISGDVKNVQTDITELKRRVSNFTNTNQAFEDFVTEVKNSLAFPVSGLGQALKDAKDLQTLMSQLNIIEDKVNKAASLSSLLLATDSVKSLPSEDKQIAQNLTTFLTEIENVAAPLFLSLVYDFNHIQATIGDLFATLANKTQCRSDESIKLQISKLNETFYTLKQNTDDTPRSDNIFAYCTDAIEDLVTKDTEDLTIPLLKLRSHLQILLDVSKISHRLVIGL